MSRQGARRRCSTCPPHSDTDISAIETGWLHHDIFRWQGLGEGGCFEGRTMQVRTCIMDSIALSFATAMVRPRGSKEAWLTQLATMALQDHQTSTSRQQAAQQQALLSISCIDSCSTPVPVPHYLVCRAPISGETVSTSSQSPDIASITRCMPGKECHGPDNSVDSLARCDRGCCERNGATA
jgi:hypothetical protein